MAPEVAPSAGVAPDDTPLRKLLAIPGFPYSRTPIEVGGTPYWNSDPLIPVGDVNAPPDSYSDFPPGLSHKPLSPVEYILFKAGYGPQVSDIYQNQLGNCWHLSPLMSHLEQGGTVSIRDMGGSFTKFEVIFTVRKSITARVLIDNYVLVSAQPTEFPNGAPYTNTPLRDPVSGKLVAWPLLWVKAYAQLATWFPEIVSPGDRHIETPAPCVGYGDLQGGRSYYAIAAISGRRGTTYTPLPGSGKLDVLEKLRSGQVTIAVVSTLQVPQITSMPGYNALTRSMDSGSWTLQILRSQDPVTEEFLDKAYSLRQWPTGYTYVFPFNHAMTLSQAPDSTLHYWIGNPWGSNYWLNDDDTVKTTPDGYHCIQGLTEYAVCLGFSQIHHG